MIFEADKFVFKPPSAVSAARRILIKPDASYPEQYPFSTSRAIIAKIIEAIRKVSDADIVILEGTHSGESVLPIYKSLSYDFPRVLLLDVKDCIWVEVDNPLPKPLAVSAFWIPNVILCSDYLISITPLKIEQGKGHLSIPNLMSLLPSEKYTESGNIWQTFHELGINKVMADLYFTLPFDMGIIEARQMLEYDNSPMTGKVTDIGKIYLGDPFQVDKEVSDEVGVQSEYLRLIKLAESGLDTI